MNALVLWNDVRVRVADASREMRRRGRHDDADLGAPSNRPWLNNYRGKPPSVAGLMLSFQFSERVIAETAR